MERVGQQALRAKILHGFGQHGLHRGLRGHRHERRGVDVAVGGVDDAGAAVARAAAALAIGRIWQAGFLLEVERVAAAGLAGFRAAGMLNKVFGRCRAGRVACCVVRCAGCRVGR